MYVPVNNLVVGLFLFGKLKIENYWREPIFNLAYYFSNLPKHNICQVNFGKLLEMLLVSPTVRISLDISNGLL